MKPPRNHRRFATLLRAEGAVLARKTEGGHQQWRLRNGARFTLAVHLGKEWKPRTAQNYWHEYQRAVRSRPMPPRAMRTKTEALQPFIALLEEPMTTALAAVEPTTNGHVVNPKHGAYPCPDCDFVAKMPQALGAHRATLAGKNGHGTYERMTRGYKAPREGKGRLPLLRVPATGRVKELQDEILARLIELSDLVEGAAVETRQLREERDDLRNKVERFERAYEHAKGEDRVAKVMR